MTIDNVLVVFADGDVRAYDRLRVPRPFLAAYREMKAAAQGMICVPELHYVDTVDGFGGFYVSGGGPIVIGQQDVRDLAVDYVVNYMSADGRIPKATFEAVVAMVYGRILSHEFGHALDDAGYAAPFFDPEERADFFAGRLDRVRGKSELLGARFFFGIGCEGPSCTHPAHGVRATAYLHGYAVQDAFMRRWA